MATLSLANAELYSELGRVLGISRTSTDWDAVTLADVNRIYRAGRRRFLSANNWRFLRDTFITNTTAPFTDGTVTIVNGVVTFAGGPTVPTDAINYLFAPAGGGIYAVESYDSTVQITLEDKTVNADALSTYTMYQIKFDLPAAFGGWEAPITIENHEGRTLNESRNFPEYVLRAFANRETVRSAVPELFSVTSTTDAETGIATHQLVLWPLPDAAYVLSSRYKVLVGDTLELATSVVVSDPVFSECYKEAILASAEITAFGQPGAHSQQFGQLLIEAIRQDNAMTGIRFGRPRHGEQRRSRFHELIVGTVSISDQEIT